MRGRNLARVMRRLIRLLCVAAVLGLLPASLPGVPEAIAAPRAKKKKSRARRRPPVVQQESRLPLESEGEQAASASAPPTRGPTRIDFDDRLIQGQTNQSGSVYLYDRKELKQRSMVRTRDSFREETLATVYDN